MKGSIYTNTLEQKVEYHIYFPGLFFSPVTYSWPFLCYEKYCCGEEYCTWVILYLGGM